MFEVRMPQLGETVSVGTVNTWLKSVGDQVSAEDPLLEITVGEGEEVPVGTVIAVIG